MTCTTGESHDHLTNEETPCIALWQQRQVKPDRNQPDQTESTLVHLLTTAINTMPPQLQPSQFQFQNTRQAAQVNYDLLWDNDFDLAKVLRNENNTVTSPAYELRPHEVVEPLLDLSSDASKLKSICFKGIRYPLRQDADLSDTTRIEDAKYWLKKVNNKSTQGKTTFIQDAITKENERGWQIAVRKATCLDIKGLCLVPASVAQKLLMQMNMGWFRKRTASPMTAPNQPNQGSW